MYSPACDKQSPIVFLVLFLKHGARQGLIRCGLPRLGTGKGRKKGSVHLLIFCADVDTLFLCPESHASSLAEPPSMSPIGATNLMYPSPFLTYQRIVARASLQLVRFLARLPGDGRVFIIGSLGGRKGDESALSKTS